MSKHEFAVCMDGWGYEVSLETQKHYQIVADSDAEKLDQIRVFDESGENYLLPEAALNRITLPDRAIDLVIQEHG